MYGSRMVVQRCELPRPFELWIDTFEDSLGGPDADKPIYETNMVNTLLAPKVQATARRGLRIGRTCGRLTSSCSDESGAVGRDMATVDLEILLFACGNQASARLSEAVGRNRETNLHALTIGACRAAFLRYYTMQINHPVSRRRHREAKEEQSQILPISTPRASLSFLRPHACQSRTALQELWVTFLWHYFHGNLAPWKIT